MRIVMTLLCILFVPAVSNAQSAMLFGGYQWTHLDLQNTHLFTSDLNGWKAGTVIQISGGLGIVGELDGVYGSRFNTGVVIRPIGRARPWFYTAEGGLRYTANAHSRINPIIEGLIGVTHGQVGTMGVDFVGTTTSTRPEGGVGGGFAIHLTRVVGAEADVVYRTSQLFDQRRNRVQIGGTVVWLVRRGK